MLARAGKLPRDDERWGYEIKWDGVRAIAFSEPGRLRFQARSGNDITARYPELARLNRALSSHRAILDGEIVAFGADGRPSFEALQRRMHVTLGVLGAAAGEGAAGDVHDLRPAVARRPLADAAALRASAARRWRSWSSTGSAGRRPSTWSATARRCWRSAPSRGSRA